MRVRRRDRDYNTKINQAIQATIATAPMIIPAIAIPRPPSPVRLIWPSATKPKIGPKMDPMPAHQSTKEHTNDAMAKPFVPTPCGGG